MKQLRPVVVNISTHTKSHAVGSQFLARPDRNERRWLFPFGQDDDRLHDSMRRFFRFFGGPEGGFTERTPERSTLGSGFLIGDGLALTNNHVIDGADEIRVTTDGAVQGGLQELTAQVVSRDPRTDVALLRLQGAHLEQLPVARLGSSDELEVGDFVVAVGEPFGLQATVTFGIVSAKERAIGAGPEDDFIQTDASINPGNSGGPLFNLRGEVVGINTAIINGANTVGFAIPISAVEQLLPQLRSGKVVRGYLGVLVQPVTPDMTKELGLDAPRGALVADVQTGTPAAEAQLRPGDVIVAVDGKPITDARHLTITVAATRPGTKVRLEVVRGGKQSTVEATLGQLHEEAAGGADPEKEGHAGQTDPLGLTTQDLTPEAARNVHLDPSTHGALVDHVAPGTPAARAGIEPGDVVVEVNRHPIDSVEAYRKEVGSLSKGGKALVRVRRGSGARYFAIELGG